MNLSAVVVPFDQCIKRVNSGVFYAFNEKRCDYLFLLQFVVTCTVHGARWVLFKSLQQQQKFRRDILINH